MKRMKAIAWWPAIILLSGGVAGCAAGPKPARTEVTPGESHIKSEREEKRPSESRLRIKVEPMAPKAAPSVKIRIVVPEKVEPAKPDGAALSYLTIG